MIHRISLAAMFACTLAAVVSAQQTPPFVRDPKIAIDDEYTKKIKEYTTMPFFGSPLVDYLPASKTVPTPKAVLGDVAGAPGKLPYAEEVYQYMRMLEKAAPSRSPLKRSWRSCRTTRRASANSPTRARSTWTMRRRSR